MPSVPFLAVTETVEVLGLGPSLEKYTRNGNTTIGVNDIWKFHEVDFIVCIDPPWLWEEERYPYLVNAKAKKFFTNRVEWKGLVRNYEYMQLARGRGNLYDLNTPGVVPYSNNSTFVAAVMAYKLGAKNIILHGADFKTHPKLSRQENFSRVLKDFGNLRKELLIRKVSISVSCKSSALWEVFSRKKL